VSKANGTQMAAVQYKSSTLMEALIVLADSTEYWHFGGTQPCEIELSFWIESGKARRIVEGALAPMLLVPQQRDDADLSELLKLISPRLKQLRGWMANDKKPWPLGFQLSAWNTDDFETRAEWRADQRHTRQLRDEHMDKMLHCLEMLEEVESLMEAHVI
jgi:hypothetical protein